MSYLLLIRPGGIGDAILLIPTLQYLRKIFPASSIDVLAEKRNAGSYDLCPEVDQVFCYDKARDFATVLRRRYDVIIDMEQWHRLSAIVARTIRSPMKIGFGTNDRSRLFTHSVDYSHERYELNSFLDLLASMEIEPPAVIAPPFLTVPPAEQESADFKESPGVYHRILSMLVPNVWKARAAYDSFNADGLGEGWRDDFHSGTCEGRLLGDDDFVDEVLGKVNQRRQTTTVADILDAVSCMYGKSLEELQAPGKSRPYTEARAMASLLVQEMPHLSLTELAKSLRRDIASLGRVGRRLRDQGMNDESIGRHVEKLRKELSK